MKIKKIRIISATPYTDVKPNYAERIGQETWVIDDNSLYYGRMANPECDEKGNSDNRAYDTGLRL
mgnify:CR=1 FL=1